MSIQINNQQSAISNRQFVRGFSLTEVLLAVGILAVGMLFIAGVFPVSILFTTVATERTIAATVADEAFAKIKLYGISDANVFYNTQTPYEKAVLVPIADAEFGYPSTPTTDPISKRYWWSAICRRVGPSDVQVTVFISRKVGMTTTYYMRNPLGALGTIDRPVPVFVSVTAGSRPDEIAITDMVPADTIDERTFINDGYTIVDDATGNIYRVLERYAANPNVIRLDKDWVGTLSLNSKVWVVPPPSSFGGGRYPCIAVYQKIIRF
jgi:prepilin-type N-terminal cleavage/methylation domain-containing protein